MKKKSNKLLTLFITTIVVLISVSEVFAQVMNQEKAQTHLRWNIFTDKENLVIEKRGNRLLLKTLNTTFFNQIASKIKTLPNQSRYIKSVKVDVPGKANNVSTIEVTMAEEVEVFNFFRDRDKKHVFDFWKEDEDKLLPVADASKVTKTISKKAAAAPLKKKVKKVVGVAKPIKKAKPAIRKKIVRNPDYRDFRYGASFVWDYAGYGPELPKTLNLDTKTPEYFYPIKNRDYSKNDKEAHLQLALNFYRKKKYGLMYKSIKLFQEKYGADESIDFIEYLKANAIIRDHIAGGNREPLKMAINMLSSISGRSKNYELQKAIYKYLLTYYQKSKEFVEALSIAKRFYVKSKENFDYEESQYAALAILHSLTELNQVEKVAAVINEETIKKIIPRSTLIAYQIYVHFKMGDMKKVLSIYRAKKSGLTKPIDGSILFNVGEALFRSADYQSSISIFDSFLSSYSFHPASSAARLRLALAFDIMEKNVKQTIVLYKNAINRSQDPLISSEARIRYAALRSIRKLELGRDDIENRAFLDIDENINLSRNLKKLLWLTRLRSFIVDGEYKKALTYLSALPLTSLARVDRRVFEADGAEIIYGIIKNSYQNSDYSLVVKDWTRNKDRYVSKVANDHYLNFIVGKSFLKLGLYEGFNDLYASFTKLSTTPARSFPIWVNRPRQDNSQSMLLELEVTKNLKLKNWDQVKRGISKLRNIYNRNNKVNLYSGIMNFKKKAYKTAAMDFEKFLSSSQGQSIFDPMDLANMVIMYTDSLYELGMLTKFQNVADAILSDTDNYAPKNSFMKSMRERLEYLSIEIEAGKGTASAYLKMEPRIISFKKTYSTSDYDGRINYLLGMAFAKNKKVGEAKKLFQELLSKETTPASVKELVRSELSLMAIKERTL